MVKEYPIEHISDILKIPEPKFEKFLEEFKACLHSAFYMNQAIAETARALGAPVPEMRMPKIIWKDDDEKKLTISMDIKGKSSERKPK
jgi:hypothetical protein